MELLLFLVSVVSILFFCGCVALPFFLWKWWKKSEQKHPAITAKIVPFGCFSCFVICTILFGLAMTAMGFWLIVFPFCVIGGLLWLPGWFSYKNLVTSKMWRVAYIVFCVCGVVWASDLSGWSDSAGAKSFMGVFFFTVGSLAMLLLGISTQRSILSKLFAVIAIMVCVMGTIKESVIAPKLFCPEDKPLLSRGTCYSCDNLGVLTASESRCDVCGNMRRIDGSDKCILSTCPSSHPLRDSYNNCTEACPDDKPVRSRYRGECYPCDYTEAIYSADAETCDKCGSMRVMSKGDACILTRCPKDNPLRKGESCVSCDENEAIRENDSQCVLCENRTMIDGKCVLRECPASHPLRTKYGHCYACNYSHEFDATEEECAACATTHVYVARDDKCVDRQIAAYRERLYNRRNRY